jgi:hypothetical protein
MLLVLPLIWTFCWCWRERCRRKTLLAVLDRSICAGHRRCLNSHRKGA